MSRQTPRAPIQAPLPAVSGSAVASKQTSAPPALRTQSSASSTMLLAVKGEAAASSPTDGSSRSSWAERRSEEHTSELQSLMRISYAVFCLKKKKPKTSIDQQLCNLCKQHR